MADFFNETEFKFEREQSSIELFNFKWGEHVNKKKSKYQNSSQWEKPDDPALLDDLLDEHYIEIKAKKEIDRVELLVDKLTKELVIELKYFSVDSSDISSAERKILDIQDQYSFRVLGEVIQNIYVQYNDYPNVLAGICKGLNRFELQEVTPWGPTMLSGLLGHKSEIVKEYAVSLVENWSGVDLLPILRNIDCTSTWLKEYITDVVNYLEECDAIHKKIV